MSTTSSADPGLGGSTWGTVLNDILVATRRLLDAAACSVAVISDNRCDLVYVAADGEGAVEVVGLRIPVTHGIAGFVAGSGQSLMVNDVSTDHRFARDTAERTGYIPTSITVLPLYIGGDTIGVLSILDAGVEPPPESLTALAAAIARIVDLQTFGGGSTDDGTPRIGNAPSAAGLARAGRELAERVAADTELGHGVRQFAASVLLTVADQLDNG